MLAVPVEEQIAVLNASIKCWQHTLFWFTGVAAVSGIIVSILEIRRLARWRPFNILFGVLSGVCWAMTILCASNVNTQSFKLQNIYAHQSEQAEEQVQLLQPKVQSLGSSIVSIEDHVQAVEPKVQTIEGKVQTLEPKVQLLERGVRDALSGVRAGEQNENEIREIEVDVSYQINFSRGTSSTTIAQTYNTDRGNPQIRCDGLTIPLMAEVRVTHAAAGDSHTNRIVYRLLERDQLIGKPINLLDTCHILAIPVLKLGVELPKTDLYYSIPYLDAQFVINGFPLPKMCLKTDQRYWVPRLADAGSVTLLLNATSPSLSEQYFHRHNP